MDIAQKLQSYKQSMFSGVIISDQPLEFHENEFLTARKNNWNWKGEKGKNFRKGFFNYSDQRMEVGMIGATGLR